MWNLLLAGARDSHAFAVIVLLVGALVGAPVAVFFWDFHAAVWPYLIASSALELAYFGLLAFAYTHAELSVVYPLARGLAPVLVLAGAVVFTGADTSARQVSGVALVGAGILLVRGVRGGRGAWLAVLIGCVIASYTVVDKHGVAHASPVAYLEVMSIFTGARLRVDLRRVPRSPRTTGRGGVEVGWRGVGTFAAYACVLAALQLASAASVAAVRESGVLVATALAAIFLHERVTPWRAGGRALVVAGVVLLSA